MKLGKISLAAAVLLSALLFGGADAKANGDPNWGYLTFEPQVGNSPINNLLTVVKDDGFLDPDPNDSIDDHDVPGYGLYMNGASWIYSDVNGTDLWGDFRANASRTPIRVKVGYKGTIAEGSEPNIIVELSWLYAEETEGRFGDMPLIATKETVDGNNIEDGGYRGNIRAEMDYSGPDFASINFGKLPAGSYTENTPFLHLRVDFDKLLADLNGDGIVNLKDYAIMAKYYGKEGRCIADITGPDEIPDKNLDYWDLSAFCGDYLKEE